MYSGLQQCQNIQQQFLTICAHTVRNWHHHQPRHPNQHQQQQQQRSASALQSELTAKRQFQKDIEWVSSSCRVVINGLPVNFADELLNHLLPPPGKEPNAHLSAAPSLSLESLFAQSRASRSVLLSASLGSHPLLHVTRSFHSRSRGRRERIGIGSDTPAFEAKDEAPPPSFFSRLLGGGSHQRSPAMKELLTKMDSPQDQDKLKIAFAEGYMAHDGGKKERPGLSRWIRIAAVAAIVYLLYKMLVVSGGMGRRLGEFVVPQDFEVNPEEVSVGFDDVKGVDEAKDELEEIVEYLKDPSRFTHLGGRLPKGVLLVGPPGIGKTLLARAVAGEAKVPFFHASGSEFDEMFVGVGARKIRQLFEAAKVRAPCVIFIDEIDSVGAKRTSSQLHPYANQTVNQLLSEMDGFEKNLGIIVLAATNRRDNLDSALLRPGRFDVEIRLYLPDLKGRKEIFEIYLNKVKHADDVDLEYLARGSTGFSGADIENMVNQAALRAAIDRSTSVRMEHLEWARDKVLMGPAKKSKLGDEETNRMTAFHEAGHTIVAYYTKDAEPLHKVTIIPRGMALGVTSFMPEKDAYSRSKAQLMADMDVAMGGRLGEELIYGADRVTTGASNDFEQATAIATAMVKKYGMSEKAGPRVYTDKTVDAGFGFVTINELSPGQQELVDQEIKRLLNESYERARAILKTHAVEHRALAEALFKQETLDAAEVKAIVEGKTAAKAGIFQ